MNIQSTGPACILNSYTNHAATEQQPRAYTKLL